VDDDDKPRRVPFLPLSRIASGSLHRIAPEEDKFR
jgi:hypothetical protein